MLGSNSSRTVGDMAWDIVLRPADNDDDSRRSMRLARVDFVSDFSSLVDEFEPAVAGGENPAARSRLFLRLPIEAGRPCTGDL